MQESDESDRFAQSLSKAQAVEPGRATADGLKGTATGTPAVAVQARDRRAEALKALKQRRWTLPEGYEFDREEANERSAR